MRIHASTGVRVPWAVLLVAFLSPVARAADFLGPETCKGCHPEAYLAWKQSKHAHALESLTPQQQRDARCLTCHAPNQQETSVSEVTCETCHGGGQYYAPAYVMKDSELARLVGLLDPSEKSCRGCHDAASPSLKSFEFAEKLKLMDHWSAERARRGLSPAASGTQAPGIAPSKTHGQGSTAAARAEARR